MCTTCIYTCIYILSVPGLQSHLHQRYWPAVGDKDTPISTGKFNPVHTNTCPSVATMRARSYLDTSLGGIELDRKR